MAQSEVRTIQTAERATTWKQVTGWLGLAVCLLAYPWLVMGPWGERLLDTNLRLAIFVLAAGFAAICLRWARPQLGWVVSVAGGALLVGAVYKMAAFLPEITTYPLSLGWSEASRFYYASLFFSDQLYGQHVPPSVLHPTRYLMQSVPFLIPSLPLWFHRLWQVLLWVVLNLAAALLLARRLSLAGWERRLLFTLWAFLFLFQGPVYYHLLVMVVLVLWGFDRQNIPRSVGVVLLASAWAGVSRINWVPVPGMLAAALYFLETPYPASKAGKENPLGRNFWRYLALPAGLTVAGTLVGLAVQQAYVFWSGNPPEVFGSSFSSDLLWYRLFSSETYPLGVIPATLYASLPMVLVVLANLILTWRQTRTLRNPHPLRLLALGAILGVLLAGGVVVSVKIGGGSNLHNLDAYLTLLLVAGSYLLTGDMALEDHTTNPSLARAHPSVWVLAAYALATPLYFTLIIGGPLPDRNFEQAQAAIVELRQAVAEAQAGSPTGEVLFITERHLLTFNDLPGVPLVPEYERVFLMEMAMSNNQPYLQAFYEDLRTHRFARIVTNPLHRQYQGRTKEFGEENDAWVARVSEIIMCYYTPVKDLPGVPVQILAPREENVECP